jgi:hypothetical protein
MAVLFWLQLEEPAAVEDRRDLGEKRRSSTMRLCTSDRGSPTDLSRSLSRFTLARQVLPAL